MAKEKKTSGFSLKDELFNKERVEYLAELFHTADRRFDAKSFARDAMKELKKLELKERIVHIAGILERYLDDRYQVAAKQIVEALPPPLDPRKSDDDFGDFIFAPLGEYVVRNGLAKKHLKLSLRTLKELTQRFSMEDSIRYFIDAHPEVTLAELSKWTTHSNYHVRRLVSEGTRPRLPWSGRLSIDVTVPLPFLDALHSDPTRYVTRSVANHLNDIAKTDPKLVLDALKRWKKQGDQTPAELKWMSKHATRTLVKQGDLAALRFLGFRPSPKIKIIDFVLETPAVSPGDTLEFSFVVEATQPESLMVDYVIDFVKSNGQRSPKVHKLEQVVLTKGQSLLIKKRHPLRANATTFTLYPGIHHLTLQINGKRYGTQSFTLS